MTASIDVAVEILSEGEGLELPTYMTMGAAGADAVAAVSGPMTIAPGERALIPLGFKVAISTGFEMQIRPRSGLALKHGVTVLNSPGTIDSDYRGPVGVILINLGRDPFVVNRGDRIAQLVVSSVRQVSFLPVNDVGATTRGEGGFGSTGRAHE